MANLQVTGLGSPDYAPRIVAALIHSYNHKVKHLEKGCSLS